MADQAAMPGCYARLLCQAVAWTQAVLELMQLTVVSLPSTIELAHHNAIVLPVLLRNKK